MRAYRTGNGERRRNDDGCNRRGRAHDSLVGKTDRAVGGNVFHNRCAERAAEKRNDAQVRSQCLSERRAKWLGVFDRLHAFELFNVIRAQTRNRVGQNLLDLRRRERVHEALRPLCKIEGIGLREHFV